jgi:hypothetical protein
VPLPVVNSADGPLDYAQCSTAPHFGDRAPHRKEPS